MQLHRSVGIANEEMTLTQYFLALPCQPHVDVSVCNHGQQARSCSSIHTDSGLWRGLELSQGAYNNRPFAAQPWHKTGQSMAWDRGVHAIMLSEAESMTTEYDDHAL